MRASAFDYRSSGLRSRHGPESLLCVLGPDALFSQCLSTLRARYGCSKPDKGKAKSVNEPSGLSGRSLSWFPWHGATRNICTPPWMGCPPALNSPIPIYTPGWREALRELSVLPKNTTQCPRPGLEPGAH